MSLDVDGFLGYLHANGSDVSALARAWDESPHPDRAAGAFAAGGVQLDQYDSLVAAVSLSEALEEVRRDNGIAALVPETIFTLNRVKKRQALGPGLHIAPALAARLPLLDLAEDIARARGRLSVEIGPSPDWAGMCFQSCGLILIDDSRDDEQIGCTFRHELAHMLDPHLDVVTREGKEAFAMVLGLALGRVPAPTSLDEVGPMVAHTLEVTSVLRTPRAPAASGARGILELILLELAVRRFRVPASWSGVCEPNGRHGGSGRQTGIAMGLGHPRRSPQGHASPSSARWSFLHRDGALRPEPPSGFIRDE